ncbi:MAG TPA: FAD-dependent oxidoreductase [Patescibacteria group bacterium]|nr:FAD-dependent oxidoreductase [Patescibacteria group bacterium]
MDPRRRERTGHFTRREFLRSAAVAAGGTVAAATGAARGARRGAGPVAGGPASAAASATAPAATKTQATGPHVAVIGAGAFGGWTALMLRRRGARVTLVDAWGAGNPRASSGGETRVIRSIYGKDEAMTRMAARALALWRENERRFGVTLFHPTGVLWMTGEDDRYVRDALPNVRAAGLTVDEITLADAAARWPQIRFDGVRRVLLEKDAGYLLARDACDAVQRAFVAAGGDYLQAEARPFAALSDASRIGPMALGDGTILAADVYVFACGPWLGTLFGNVIGDLVRPTRQELFVFGPPAGDVRYTDARLPVWIDLGERLLYGIPASGIRGFKFGDDTRGALFDPTTGDRTPSAEGARAARLALGRRFPALKDAPIVEASVCQYENTPDGRFIIDRHPRAANVFFAGGGSGHGFKHGPAIGELVASMALGETPPDPAFGLARFAT